LQEFGGPLIEALSSNLRCNHGPAVVRAEPFTEIELELSSLWAA
jgi:hypothetical protein